MLKVAITGNIASGKSTVEKIIERKGFKVYDTDIIAHQILENSNEIKKIFGTTDRKELANIVFSNKAKLRKLESIIHPKVKDKLIEIFNSNLKTVFISVPQLFETGFDKMFDKIIFVTADKSIRKERLMIRNSLTDKEAQKRIDAQDDFEKEEKSDFIIKNNSNIDELQQQIDNILSILI